MLRRDLMVTRSDRRPRVLVVEDDPANRSVLCEMLEDEGYEARAAGGGQEGLRQLVEFAPGVVLLDLMMPDLDGRQFRERQKTLDPPARDVPVVVLTASLPSSTDVEQLGAELDVAAVVRKPFDLDDLLPRLEALIGA